MNKKEIVPYLTSGWRIPAILGLVLILLGFIFWVYSDGHKKEGELIGNVGEANGKNTVLANLVKNAQSEANNAHQDSTNAETNFNISVNRDSSEFDSNFNAGTNVYCSKFKCDSSCLEWRKVNAPHLFCPQR